MINECQRYKNYRIWSCSFRDMAILKSLNAYHDPPPPALSVKGIFDLSSDY